MAYTIYFIAESTAGVEHVSVQRLFVARLIWDALDADGAKMLSTRP